MNRRIGIRAGRGKPVGRVPVILLLCATLLSCERNPGSPAQPDRAPDHTPKPQTGTIEQRPGVQSAVFSFVGRPAPMYRPEIPIPVRHAVVRT